MKRLKVNLFLCIVGAVLLALLLAPAVAQAQAAWSVVPSPSPGPSVNDLNGVASISANDVWAVGDFINASGASQTLIENWNGTQWNIVASPNPRAFRNVLRGVTAISTNDVWAVGWFNNAQDIPRTLIEHWNGSSWSVVTSPNGSKGSNFLFGVTAVSSTDVWAFGSYLSGGVYHTLTIHWDGSGWSVVPSPSPGTGIKYPQGALLRSGWAASSADVWAVGRYYSGTAFRNLTLHWDGSAWTSVSSPNQGSGNNELRGIGGTGSSDVWTVGYYYNGSINQSLVEHWDSASWHLTPTPNGGGSGSYLKGVAAVGPTNAWSVGYFQKSGLYRTLIEHWTGSAWGVVPRPNA